ncbi:unnamed protein product [Bubo scandiacus]
MGALREGVAGENGRAARPVPPPVPPPRHPGSSRCPRLSSAAPPVPSHERPGTPTWAPRYPPHGGYVEMDAQGPIPSVAEESKRTDYSKWQKTKAEEGKSPARRLTLPPLTEEDKKKKGENKKPVKKTPLPSETSSSQETYRSFTQRRLALRKAELAKTLEEIKVATNLTNLKKNAIEELKQRSARLAESSCRLVKDIQRTDGSTAKQARSLLQRYEVLQRVQAMEQTFFRTSWIQQGQSSRKWKKTMEKNLGKLQQQLVEVTSKVEVLQDALGVLQTYIDGQHPEPTAQILLLQGSIQNLKEQQQEEIEKTEEVGKAIMEALEKKARAEQEALLQKVMEETLLHQDGLKQMVINNHVLTWRGEIGELKISIQTLCQSARDLRELIFADVLLHRLKCSPDTEVTLSLPAEGMLLS